MGRPRSAFEVRRDANANLQSRMLGYRCQQILGFVEWKAATGCPPSYSEICDEFGMHAHKVSEVIARLERYGYLIRVPQSQRGHRYGRTIRLTREA